MRASELLLAAKAALLLGMISRLVCTVPAQQFVPADVGTTVQGYQDDFDAATRDPNWVVSGVDVFYQSGGSLYVNSATGDPNHLLYAAAGYDDSVQEVLARIRVQSYGSGDFVRGGLGAAVDPANSQGINYLFRNSTSEGQTGNHMAFLDDRVLWGPGQAFAWQANAWYWVRLRHEPDAVSQGGVDDVFAKIWLGDGSEAEPANWQFTWDYTPLKAPRVGYAGITASSGAPFQFEVDYVLIKAAGLPNIQVSPSACVQIPVAITNQPQNLTVMELFPAAFKVGTAGVPAPSYQWYRGTTPIVGATDAGYTLSSAAYTDTGAQFKVVAQNIVSNITYSVTSTVATLTVISDTNPPVLVGALALGLSQVQVSFSERVASPGATNLGSYAITGTNGVVTIFGAALDSSQTNVILTVSPMTDGGTYTLTVNNVVDLSHLANRIVANSQAQFLAATFTSAGVGDPVPQGGVAAAGNGWNISGSGSDVGGTEDQFQFSYQQRTGDFDVMVRIDSLTLVDAWSEAGMAAREGLTAGARSASVVATPSISGCYFQSRSVTNATTTLAGAFPVNYPNTWLRLKRAGSVFTGYAGFDGRNWTQLGTATLTMGPTIYFGFAVSSRSPGQLAMAAFRDFGTVTTAGVNGALSVESPGQCSRRTSLTISEIMYHPASTNLEFVEISNSRGEYADLSGYRLAGSVDFTFPAGTILSGGGFVVVARSPADLQSAYGISGVLGPFTNNLPNDNGKVELVNQAGGVLLEVNYSDRAPWPLAADGAGHSLVLARPSYGEDNPLAWAASDSIGGSPGRIDPFTADPLRGVVINEFLAHTDPPDLDYIELYNHSNQSVDISRGVLTDDAATNKFIIPDGTVIPAHGFVYYTEATLNFALNAAGETLYFKNAARTRVIDAVHFEGQENGVATGRFPDGADQFYRLSSKTPGAANSSILVSGIVINELMYHPISEDDEDQYVELYNRGVSPVNLGGWALREAVTFTFPSNTTIAPDGYLVVGKSAGRLVTNYPNLNAANTLGDFSGKLSGKGERIALTKPDTIVSTNASGQITTNRIQITVDDVIYGAGGRWPQWSDGGGSSLELTDPLSNHRLPSSWADSDETRKAPWTLVSATGTIDNGSTTADQLQVLLQGAGECLLDNVEVLTAAGSNLIANSTFEAGAGGWTAEGTESLSGLETTEGYNSARSYHLRAVERGDNQVNRVRTPLASTLASGTANVTIRAVVRWLKGHPEVLLRLRGNWHECVGTMALPVRPGTPGARNSRYVANAPPAIYAVQHSPVLPAASQTILVTTRIDDPHSVAAVVLKFRVDPGSAYSAIAMTDDGQGGDAVPGDGIYSAVIPGQPSGSMLAFYIQATDGFPQPASATFPSDAPVRECLIRVGEVQPTGNFPVYRIWMTQATLNTWAGRSKLNNSPFDVTFVLNDNRVIYNAQSLYAGSPYIAPGYCGPTCGRCGYTLNVPADDLFLGETDHVLDWPGGHGNETSGMQEEMGYWIADRLNLPYSHRWIIRLHVNGVTDAARQAVFEAVQQPAKGFVDQWSPQNSDGQFFKIDRAFEFNDSGGLIADPQPRLMNYTTTGGFKKREKYRWNFAYRGGTRVNNYTNIFGLADALNATAPEPYSTASFGLVDVEEWMRIFAAEHIIVNFDAYGHVIGKNMYAFLPKGGKWALYMFDLDWLMLAAPRYRADYAASTAPLFESEDPTIARMYSFPPFLRAYWRAVQDAIDGPLAAANCNPLMDAKYRSLVANGVTWCDGQALTEPTVVKTWFSQRRTYLQSQLATVASPFSVSSSIAISNGLGILTGTAPVGVSTVSINGTEWSVTWNSVTTWTAKVPLQTGNNSFSVVGVDVNHRPIGGASNTVSVVYSGVTPSPVGSVVINEIMLNPLLPDAQYVELFNTSASYAFDLSGWNFNGLAYTFPAGTFMAPRGFLLLAKDRVGFDMAYGPSLPVYDEFPGNLKLDGETLSLLEPGIAPASDLIVDRVRYETNAPWPVPAAGRALQLVDASQENSRVGNWGVGELNPLPQPQWVYAWTNISATSSRFYIYLLSTGDIYVDDFQLVSGLVPEVGSNLLRDGDFESPLGTDWNLTANFTGSAVSTTFRHTGSNSLHIVASAAGTGSGNAIYQDISPALTTGGSYTLSFWYRQSGNGGPLVVRLSGATTNPTFSPAPALPVAAAVATPGSANSISAGLPAFPTLWLNELQAENLTGPADNFGEHDPWIELYNPGNTAVALASLYLGTNYSSPTLWAFPPDASIAPGQFLVVWADGQAQQTANAVLHTNFRLPPGNGALALSRFVSNSLQIVDYLTYMTLPANYSYGDVPDGQPFYREPMYRATPGATNNAALPPILVFINEWLAENTAYFYNPTTGKYDDWFELYNPSDVPAELAGYYLTDTLTNQFQYQIPAGFRVPARGFLLVWADNATSANTNTAVLHVPFKLSKDGEAIGLFAPDGSAIDAVTFGVQTSNVSEGRFPDGGALRLFMAGPSPGAPNILPPANEPPAVTFFAFEGSGAVALSFQTSPGHSYRVEFKDDLQAAFWTPLGQDVFATATEIFVNDPSPSPSQRYYRVVQLD
ncbi:MAG TPA: lamin tail domain-containing protein [Verrucomicrobiae bacterium]